MAEPRVDMGAIGLGRMGGIRDGPGSVTLHKPMHSLQNHATDLDQ
jgi:hypothetical protein